MASKNYLIVNEVVKKAGKVAALSSADIAFGVEKQIYPTQLSRH